MAQVATAEGLKPTMGQSPFAIIRGQAFEKSLFRNDGKQMLTALRASGVVPEKADGLADFRLRLNGGRLKSLDQALEHTARMLTDFASRSRRKDDPWLVGGATVRIPGGVMLPEAILVLDALVIRHDLAPRRLIVGEIKTYPDRGGYTDARELATARAQAGVYVHGLELVLAELGVSAGYEVSTRGFLVLTRPGFNRPSIRADEDLRYQAERARRGFALPRQAAESMPHGNGRPNAADIIAAPIHYCEACLSFCDRAPGCRARAMAAWVHACFRVAFRLWPRRARARLGRSGRARRCSRRTSRTGRAGSTPRRCAPLPATSSGRGR